MELFILLQVSFCHLFRDILNLETGLFWALEFDISVLASLAGFTRSSTELELMLNFSFSRGGLFGGGASSTGVAFSTGVSSFFFLQK